MPAYDFRCETCQKQFEQRHSIKTVPRTVPCIDGSCTGTAQRQLSIGSGVNTQPCSSKYPYVSDRLPFKLPGCQHVGKLGKNVIRSRQHEDQVLKTTGYVRE